MLLCPCIVDVPSVLSPCKLQKQTENNAKHRLLGAFSGEGAAFGEAVTVSPGFSSGPQLFPTWGAYQVVRSIIFSLSVILIP